MKIHFLCCCFKAVCCFVKFKGVVLKYVHTGAIKNMIKNYGKETKKISDIK